LANVLNSLDFVISPDGGPITLNNKKIW